MSPGADHVTVSVRVAREGDVDDLIALNRDVQQLHAELEPTFFKAELHRDEIGAFLACKLDSPGHHIRLAEIERRPCGYVWFEMQERPETPFTFPTRRVYIHHLSVLRGDRRKGVASTLLDQVDREARSAGITLVALDTWAANASGRDFFAARGFEPFSIGLRRNLA